MGERNISSGAGSGRQTEGQSTQKTIIEAGHFYSVNGPSAASLKGWQLGKQLAAGLSDAGLALFVDDYHKEQTFLEPGDSYLGDEEAEAAVQTMTQEADHVFSEAAIARGASEKIHGLLEDGAVKVKRGTVSVAGIRLGTMFDHQTETFKPTCVFLDFMLIGEKAGLGPNQVTVLPETYEKEQAQLTTVLGQLVVPELSSYEPYYFTLGENGHGNVGEVEL
jgi:hypothetical protein